MIKTIKMIFMSIVEAIQLAKKHRAEKYNQVL